MTIDPKMHRSLAVEANNTTWDILGRPLTEISPDDAEEMTRRAYAAAYHWQRAEGSTPTNSARADWLLSRVWVVQGVGAQAMMHAQRCMATCEFASLGDFDRAYAHEALARAHACLGQVVEAKRHKELAAQVRITDPEDRAMLDGDLESEPWFGVT